MTLRRPPWWAAVFAVALLLRLAHVALVDKPIGQRHIYLTSGLWIAEHPRPVDFVLRHDDWRDWPGGWTLAPLYPLFLAGLFSMFGTGVRAFQISQALMDAGAAVAVGALGRTVAPRRGAWAGMAYALYWPSAFLATRPLTENLHTFLLAPALLLLARATASAEARTAAAGGALLGLSALARAVSAAFLPIAALLPLRFHGVSRGRRAALVIAVAGAAVILPWTARNVFLRDDRTLIEDVSAFNLWNDNAYVDEATFAAQKRELAEAKDAPERRARALAFALSNIRGAPLSLAGKAWDNLRHLVRPDGLHQWLVAEDPEPWWWHAGGILFGDTFVVLGLGLFLAGSLRSARTPAGSVLVTWSAYYLFLLVVPYHSEIRYRSALVPAFLALCASGLEAAAERLPGRALRIAGLLGLAAGLAVLSPYVPRLIRATEARFALRDARAAIAGGDLARALAAARKAAARDPEAAGPWLTYARWLAERGFPGEGAAAREEALRRRPGHPAAVLALPALLREAGLPKRADRALAEAQAAEAGMPDALEIAWRELPAPRTDGVQVGRDDLGALRGFHVAEDGRRWTRPRAWIRLSPATDAPLYDVSLFVGAPAPAPDPHAELTIWVAGQGPRPIRLDGEVREHTFAFRRANEEPVLMELSAPAWSRSGGLVDRGVLFERLELRPVPAP